MRKKKFHRGANVKLTKFTRVYNVYGWVVMVYYGVIAEMGGVIDNSSTPDTSELEPISIRLKDGSLISFGNKYELSLM